jgi:hypothetical protein
VENKRDTVTVPKTTMEVMRSCSKETKSTINMDVGNYLL